MGLKTKFYPLPHVKKKISGAFGFGPNLVRTSSTPFWTSWSGGWGCRGLSQGTPRGTSHPTLNWKIHNLRFRATKATSDVDGRVARWMCGCKLLGSAARAAGRR